MTPAKMRLAQTALKEFICILLLRQDNKKELLAPSTRRAITRFGG
jgi:hypothetical protein